MNTRISTRHCTGWASLLMVVCAGFSVAGDEPRRVLLINSFGREFAPYDAFAGNFRTEIVRQSTQPVDVYEVSLESARFGSDSQEGPTVAYLLAMFAGHRLDLVVPMGGPAVRFAQKHRSQLFPATPMLMAAVDQRHVRKDSHTTNDMVVAILTEPARALENLLLVLPQTTNVCVIIGNSPRERFWLSEFHREFQPFTNRVDFIWFNELSFAEILKRCAALPARTAILYAVLAVDADGAPHTEDRALASLRAAATAPIFGLHDTQLGRGIVGGQLMGIEGLSRTTAKVAVRMLRGGRSEDIERPPQQVGTPQFDWRELRRWNIPESRLPAGSLVKFREHSAWERFQGRIVAVAALCLAQALLIVGLLKNLGNRRRAESSLKESRNYLRAILDTAVEGIITINERGVIESVNAATEKLFGYPAAELLGQNVSLIMPAPFRDEHDQYLAKDQSTRAAKIIGIGREVSGRRKDGSVFPIDLAVREIVLADRRVFTGFMRDITERKQSDQTAREFGGAESGSRPARPGIA